MGGVTIIQPMTKIARILLNTIGLVNLLPLIEGRANETGSEHRIGVKNNAHRTSVSSVEKANNRFMNSQYTRQYNFKLIIYRHKLS